MRANVMACELTRHALGPRWRCVRLGGSRTRQVDARSKKRLFAIGLFPSQLVEGLLQADSLFVAGEANLRAISHWAPTSP